MSELAGARRPTGLPDDDDGVRAVLGHLARAGVLTPAPGAARPRRRADHRRLGPPGRGACAWPRRARPSGCAGASTGRCGATSRATAAAGGRCSTTSGTVRGSAAGRGAVLRRVRGRPGPGSAGACARPGGGAAGGPAPGNLDEAILDVVVSAQPPGRAAPARSRSSAAGAPRWWSRTPMTAWRRYGAFAHLRSEEVLGRVDELLARGDAALHRRALPQAGRGMNVGVLASGTGTNLQALIDRAHGRDGVVLRGVASDKPEARALERAREAGIDAEVVRLRARSRTVRRGMPPSSAGCASARSSWWCWPATCSWSQRRVPGRVPGPGDQRAPVAAAGLPGAGRGAAGARLRGQGVRGHRVLRRRRRRHRAGHRPAGASSCPTPPTPTPCSSCCIRSSTSCSSTRCARSRAGAVRRDPANPRRVVISR